MAEFQTWLVQVKYSFFQLKDCKGNPIRKLVAGERMGTEWAGTKEQAIEQYKKTFNKILADGASKGLSELQEVTSVKARVMTKSEHDKWIKNYTFPKF